MPPNQLETKNMVKDDTPPYCRPCGEFHEESTCPNFCHINENGFTETSNYVDFPRVPYFINMVVQSHPMS